MITIFPLRTRAFPALRHFSALLALSALPALVTPAAAHDFTAGALKIGHPWSRPTPGGAKIGGGYLSITNTGTAPDRLTGGSTEMARAFEMHEMKMEGDVMRMRALDKGVEIRPGETVEFAPGGFHLMLIDLKAPLKQGESFKGQLVFEKAGRVEVEFRIEMRGATAPPQDHGTHGQGMPGQGAPGQGAGQQGSKAP